MAGCCTVHSFARWTALICIILIFGAGFSAARSFNVTVDDLHGPSSGVGESIVYSGNWNQSGPGFDRVDFRDSPGFEETVNHTWHKSTRIRNVSGPRSSASLNFEGTAVYVSCIRNQAFQDGSANSEMYFEIDGNLEGNFTQRALTSGPGQITTVFAKEGLRSGNHTIVIFNGPENERLAVYDTIAIFLDAITYTSVDDSPVSSSLSSHQIGIIVGGVCGGLVGLIATFLIFWVWRRRTQDSNYSPTAFDPRRFVRWPASKLKAPSAQYSSDMEAMRPSQPSVNSLYMYPSPSYGQTPSAYGSDQKY